MGITANAIFAAFHANGRRPIGAKYGAKRAGGIGVRLAEAPAGFTDADYAAGARDGGIVGTVRDKSSGRYANALAAIGTDAELIVRAIMANDDGLLAPPAASEPPAVVNPDGSPIPGLNMVPAADPAPADANGADPVPAAGRNGRKRVNA